jgi:hypothetical protein
LVLAAAVPTVRHSLTPILGLILALWSATAINVGFLLQHRGLRRAAPGAGARALISAAVRSPAWLGGQALGWVGFAIQILAVALAPLALVQAFAAGGVALSVPIAAVMFAHRVSRQQTAAVLLTAAALASLPIAVPSGHDRLQELALVLCSAGVGAVALSLMRGSSAMLAIAAGSFYGVADGAIKALSVTWRLDGPEALLAGWLLLALAGTLAGFLAFQASLRADQAIGSISLMNALATLVALLCGLLAFGESLGATPLATGAHAFAVVVVLACVPTLAAAQSQISRGTDRRGRAGSIRGSVSPGSARSREHSAAGGH